MPGQTYSTTIPRGFAGTVSNTSPSRLETIPLNQANPPLAFGVPLKGVVVSGNTTYSRYTGAETAGVFAGILVRQQVNNPSSGGGTTAFSPEVPNALQMQTRITFGSVLAPVPNNTSASVLKGGTVYIRVVAATGKAVGDFESTADGVNNVAITGISWGEDGLDGANMGTITINQIA